MTRTIYEDFEDDDPDAVVDPGCYAGRGRIR